MRQGDHDAYHRRAPTRGSASWYPPQLRDKGRKKAGKPVAFTQLIAPWPLDARRRALWTKLRIMLYALDGENGSRFDEQNSAVGIVMPNPATATPAAAVTTPADFLRWCYLEDADFDSMATMAAGTIIRYRWDHMMLFADREALETRFLLLCELHNNGQVRDQARVWPPAFKNEYMRMTVLLKPLDEIRTDDRIHSPRWIGPINMEEPGLDLLESKRRLLYGGDIDPWMEAIERCAPGYLDMEEAGNGMAPNYDQSLFRTQAELVDLPWEDEK